MKFTDLNELAQAVKAKEIPAGCVLNVSVAVVVMGWRLGEGGRWLDAQGQPTPWTAGTFRPSEHHAAAQVVILHLLFDPRWLTFVGYMNDCNENSIGYLLESFSLQPFFICCAALRTVLNRG